MRPTETWPQPSQLDPNMVPTWIKLEPDKNQRVELGSGMTSLNSGWAQREPKFFFSLLSRGSPSTQPNPSELHPYSPWEWSFTISQIVVSDLLCNFTFYFEMVKRKAMSSCFTFLKWCKATKEVCNPSIHIFSKLLNIWTNYGFVSISFIFFCLFFFSYLMYVKFIFSRLISNCTS